MRTARRALAVGVALAFLAGCDDSGGGSEPEPGTAASSDTSELPSGSPTGDPGPVVTCPDTILLDPDPSLPDAVPEGATSVRLCAAEPGEVSPPVDALTNDVTSVADAVNGQQLVERRCVDLQLPTYQLAFGYPDGARFVVAGRFTRCAELLVGSGRRAKAGPPLRVFVERLRTQRSTATPPDQQVASADLDCGRPPSNLPSPVALPTDLAVAVLCLGRPERPDRATRVEIPADDLSTLVASMRTDTASSAGYLGCGAVAGDEHWIVGVSAWGDPIVMRRGCFALTVVRDLEWTPRGEARAIVRRLVAEAR